MPEMKPGRYKARRPRRPRSPVTACRACGAARDGLDAATAKAFGRPGLCRTCLVALSVPCVRPVMAG